MEGSEGRESIERNFAQNKTKSCACITFQTFHTFPTFETFYLGRAIFITCFGSIVHPTPMPFAFRKSGFTSSANCA